MPAPEKMPRVVHDPKSSGPHDSHEENTTTTEEDDEVDTTATDHPVGLRREAGSVETTATDHPPGDD